MSDKVGRSNFALAGIANVGGVRACEGLSLVGGLAYTGFAESNRGKILVGMSNFYDEVEELWASLP